MSIVLRTVKGSALTYEQLDENLSQFYYSASLHSSGTRLRLHYTGSAGLSIQPGYDEVVFPLVTNTLQSVSSTGNTTNQGIIITANGLKVTGSLDVSGSTTFNNNVIIDPAGSGTNIANSLVTVKNTSTSTSTNVPGQFIDISRNNSTITATAETTGLVSRVTSTSTVQDFGIYGAQLIGRHSGTGSADFAYGTSNVGESNGTGSVDFVIGTLSKSKITGTGTITTDYARGISIDTEVNNSNATVNNAQGIHSTVNLGDGTIGNAYVALLDFDYTGTGTISGDFAYLRIQNDTLPSIGGTGYAIRSLSTLPSTFSGSITASSFVKNGATSDDVLLGDGTTTSLSGIGGSTDTGSLLTTASVNLNEITFTKGDNNTFSITVDTGSVDLSGYARFNQVQNYTRAQYFSKVSKGQQGGPVSIDLATDQEIELELTGSATLSNPTNIQRGLKFMVNVKQDATGNRTLSYGTAYEFGESGTPTLSSGSNKMDILSFECSGNKLFFLGMQRGFDNYTLQ